jgi:hypothetical protein
LKKALQEMYRAKPRTISNERSYLWTKWMNETLRNDDHLRALC